MDKFERFVDALDDYRLAKDALRTCVESCDRESDYYCAREREEARKAIIKLKEAFDAYVKDGGQ